MEVLATSRWLGLLGFFFHFRENKQKTKHSPAPLSRCDHPSLRFRRSMASPRFLHPLTELPPPQRKCKYPSEVHSVVKGQCPSEFFFNCQLFWALVPELCGELCGTIHSDTKLLKVLLDKNQSFTWVLISYTLRHLNFYLSQMQIILQINANIYRI